MTFTSIGCGLVNLPGGGPKAKDTAERLLAQDRDKHHCFFNEMGYHNHLSHHILTVFDFGASPDLLQAIYDEEIKVLKPLYHFGGEDAASQGITEKTWIEQVGKFPSYPAFLHFFNSEVARLGVGDALELYIFGPKANGNGADMLLRLVGGAFHPLILLGYALEFNGPAIVAQALALTAVNPIPFPSWPGFSLQDNAVDVRPLRLGDQEQKRRQPSHGASLLSILRQAYSSPAMTPAPYDAIFSAVRLEHDAWQDGRLDEVKRLSALWLLDDGASDDELAARVEELVWLCALTAGAVGRAGRKPRVDLFLVHLLNMAIFLPTFMRTIPTAASKARLLRAIVPTILFILLSRGLPRIDPDLLMSYTASPSPPNRHATPSSSALGNFELEALVNPWPAIISDSLHSRDTHTVKAVRALYYAAQQYQNTPEGGAIGAFDDDGQETHKGTSKMDGTIFIRAAGLIMEVKGWVTHGQSEGRWDIKGLGWEEAWEKAD